MNFKLRKIFYSLVVLISFQELSAIEIPRTNIQIIPLQLNGSFPLAYERFIVPNVNDLKNEQVEQITTEKNSGSKEKFWLLTESPIRLKLKSDELLDTKVTRLTTEPSTYFNPDLKSSEQSNKVVINATVELNDKLVNASDSKITKLTTAKPAKLQDQSVDEILKQLTSEAPKNETEKSETLEEKFNRISSEVSQSYKNKIKDSQERKLQERKLQETSTKSAPRVRERVEKFIPDYQTTWAPRQIRTTTAVPVTTPLFVPRSRQSKRTPQNYDDDGENYPNPVSFIKRSDVPHHRIRSRISSPPNPIQPLHIDPEIFNNTRPKRKRQRPLSGKYQSEIVEKNKNDSQVLKENAKDSRHKLKLESLPPNPEEIPETSWFDNTGKYFYGIIHGDVITEPPEYSNNQESVTAHDPRSVEPPHTQKLFKSSFRDPQHLQVHQVSGGSGLGDFLYQSEVHYPSHRNNPYPPAVIYHPHGEHYPSQIDQPTTKDLPAPPVYRQPARTEVIRRDPHRHVSRRPHTVPSTRKPVAPSTHAPRRLPQPTYTPRRPTAPPHRESRRPTTPPPPAPKQSDYEDYDVDDSDDDNDADNDKYDGDPPGDYDDDGSATEDEDEKDYDDEEETTARSKNHHKSKNPSKNKSRKKYEDDDDDSEDDDRRKYGYSGKRRSKAKEKFYADDDDDDDDDYHRDSSRKKNRYRNHDKKKHRSQSHASEEEQDEYEGEGSGSGKNDYDDGDEKGYHIVHNDGGKKGYDVDEFDRSWKKYGYGRKKEYKGSGEKSRRNKQYRDSSEHSDGSGSYESSETQLQPRRIKFYHEIKEEITTPIKSTTEKPTESTTKKAEEEVQQIRRIMVSTFKHNQKTTTDSPKLMPKVLHERKIEEPPKLQTMIGDKSKKPKTKKSGEDVKEIRRILVSTYKEKQQKSSDVPSTTPKVVSERKAPKPSKPESSVTPKSPPLPPKVPEKPKNIENQGDGAKQAQQQPASGPDDLKYFQYFNYFGNGVHTAGGRSGNDNHYIEAHERGSKPLGLFQKKVRWADKNGGFGEHYWDLNH